ncbi:hypothetical protein QUF80_13245 [Desulfococcaceae bacterium HSG8]|nr:hypothetical protein [Desulfococcaceae bacterium HSG8]
MTKAFPRRCHSRASIQGGNDTGATWYQRPSCLENGERETDKETAKRLASVLNTTYKVFLAS